jgi:hypothetical protein
LFCYFDGKYANEQYASFYVKTLIISKVQAFKPDEAAWPAGTRFFPN